MSRFLFVVPPFVAHVNPTVSIAHELVARGHEVAWVGHADVRPLLPVGARFYLVDKVSSKEEVEDLRRRTGGLWMSSFKAFWEDILIPMAHGMLPTVNAAIDDFEPGALVVDQQAFAGAIAARIRGIPWATSAATAGLLAEPLNAFPNVQRWVSDVLSALQTEAGLEPTPDVDISPFLIIIYTTRAVAGAGRKFPPQIRFVGGAFENRPPQSDFPWHRLGECRRLLVSLGTIHSSAGEGFFRALVEAVADSDIQLIISAPPELVSNPPPGAIIQKWIPQVELLSHVDAALYHGGFQTMSEVLAHGLPSVVAPIAYDQSIVANLLVSSHAGLRVKFKRVNSGAIRDAVTAILEEPSYRQHAKVLQHSFNEAGGAVRAATHLEELCAVGRPA